MATSVNFIDTKTLTFCTENWTCHLPLYTLHLPDLKPEMIEWGPLCITDCNVLYCKLDLILLTEAVTVTMATLILKARKEMDILGFIFEKKQSIKDTRSKYLIQWQTMSTRTRTPRTDCKKDGKNLEQLESEQC